MNTMERPCRSEKLIERKQHSMTMIELEAATAYIHIYVVSKLEFYRSYNFDRGFIEVIT